MLSPSHFQLERTLSISVLRLTSEDGTNRLTRSCLSSLTDAVLRLAADPTPWVICGNERFFSVGADLQEIAALSGPEAYEFSKMGQRLMAAIAESPSPVYAAISGYCMGGGLDLALSCHHRIAAPGAVFGHRGAALGFITGWGGTQRLPRLIGKGRALQMFVAAERVSAPEALSMGLVDDIAADPLAEAVRRTAARTKAVL